LLDVSIKREKVSGSNWKLSVDVALRGPSICIFEIKGALNYKNGNEADLEITAADFIDANLELTFNSDKLTFTIDDLASLVTAMQDLDAMTNEKGDKTATPEDYIDVVNSHLEAAYSFKGEELAQIV